MGRCPSIDARGAGAQCVLARGHEGACQMPSPMLKLALQESLQEEALKPHLVSIDSQTIAPDLIEQVDELRRQIMAGEVSSFAAAIVYKDGCSGSIRTKAPSSGLLIGSLTRVIYRLNKELDDDS